jgi:uncharacterized membrane protein HdeD (DUF308 family)
MSGNVKTYSRTKWGFRLRGLFGIALGIFILARPIASVAALALTIAIWALIDGIVNVVHAFDLRGLVPHWGAQLAGGIVSIAFGIVALYQYPELSLGFAVFWTAFLFFSIGVLSAYAAVLQRRAGVSWGWTMLIVAPSIAAGVLAVAFPAVTLVSLMLLIAAYGIIGGIGMIVGAGLMESIEYRVHRAFRGGKLQESGVRSQGSGGVG